jgi:hypothetical protein
VGPVSRRELPEWAERFLRSSDAVLLVVFLVLFGLLVVRLLRMA